mmetsp:Transcript_15285/g.22504  ORF Transcript_15285/g.22504 Transcript_15285/m.22504 type:complete len:92 (+) Transcript_15285:168-443(+)
MFLEQFLLLTDSFNNIRMINTLMYKQPTTAADFNLDTSCSSPNPFLYPPVPMPVDTHTRPLFSNTPRQVPLDYFGHIDCRLGILEIVWDNP